MNHVYNTSNAILLCLVIVISGCSTDAKIGDEPKAEKLTESRAEHDRDENGGGEGEESGTELSLDESYNQVRNGARLFMTFNQKTNTFHGTLENTTNETLERVRVEVHLSNGLELGPSKPADLAPGEKRKVDLSATNKFFDGWTAHAEVGNDEHEGEEGGGEGRGENEGEHGGEGRGDGGEEKGEHEGEGDSK